MNKRIVIIGATSGIGNEVAKIYLQLGWKVGIAGRRQTKLEEFRVTAPKQIEIEALDVTEEDSSLKLQSLINKLGGMDVFLLSSGIGFQNAELKTDIEINTTKTNVEGFVRMTTTAFHYFETNGSGHLAVISSIAGTKGIGIAPAYSATKRFQNTYIDALVQLSNTKKLNIHFTDIRPGFVATALLKDNKYPMLMQADKVAQQIVHSINKQKRIAVIDGRYAFLVFFWKMIPRWLWERINLNREH